MHASPLADEVIHAVAILLPCIENSKVLGFECIKPSSVSDPGILGRRMAGSGLGKGTTPQVMRSVGKFC